MRLGATIHTLGGVPRQPRAEVLPDAGTFHVTSRGVARQIICHDEDDWSLLASLVRLATRRWNWHLLAYCLMPNHFHLVLTADRERLSRGMHLLNFRYAQAFNERHNRVGHLFQSRYAANVIETDEYFVSACAYVLDNAVRAGICGARDDWPWVGGELLVDLS